MGQLSSSAQMRCCPELSIPPPPPVPPWGPSLGPLPGAPPWGCGVDWPFSLSFSFLYPPLVTSCFLLALYLVVTFRLFSDEKRKAPAADFHSVCVLLCSPGGCGRQWSHLRLCSRHPPTLLYLSVLSNPFYTLDLFPNSSQRPHRGGLHWAACHASRAHRSGG